MTMCTPCTMKGCFTELEWELLLRILIAGLFGALIGFERKSRLKEAGLRTHFVVAVGSALVMIVSKYGFADVLHNPQVSLDPSRIAAQVVSGIGFLGAGTIMVQRQSVRGLTTAAGLWATAGIGLAVGAGMYSVGFGATVLVLVGLEILDRGVKLFLRRPVKVHVIIRDEHGAVHQLMQSVEQYGGQVLRMNVEPESTVEAAEPTLEVSLQFPHRGDVDHILIQLHRIRGLVSVERD